MSEGGDQDIQSLDRQLVRLQKSTRTTVPALLPMHDILRQKYSWYYNWHLMPIAKYAHSTLLILFLFFIGGIFYQTLFAGPKPVLAATTTLTASSDTTTVEWNLGGTAPKTTHWNSVSTNDANVSSIGALALNRTDRVYVTGSVPGTVTNISITTKARSPADFCDNASYSVTLDMASGTDYSGSVASVARDNTTYTTYTTTVATGISRAAANFSGAILQFKKTSATGSACTNGAQAAGTANINITYAYVTLTYSSITAPTVTTQAASSITTNSATLNGTITATGGANATTRGFKYSQGAACTDATTVSQSGSYGTGAYSLSTGAVLLSNTQYSYRAYATNSGGTGYGGCVQFTTLSGTPTAPSNPTAQADFSQTLGSTYAKVNLTWADNSSNETGFEIDRKEMVAGTWSQITTTAAGVISYPDTINTANAGGKTYVYRIRATIDGSNDSANTSEVSVQTYDRTNPAAPSLTSTGNNGENWVENSWSLDTGYVDTVTTSATAPAYFSPDFAPKERTGFDQDYYFTAYNNAVRQFTADWQFVRSIAVADSYTGLTYRADNNSFYLEDWLTLNLTKYTVTDNGATWTKDEVFSASVTEGCIGITNDGTYLYCTTRTSDVYRYLIEATGLTAKGFFNTGDTAVTYEGNAYKDGILYVGGTPRRVTMYAVADWPDGDTEWAETSIGNFEMNASLPDIDMMCADRNYLIGIDYGTGTNVYRHKLVHDYKLYKSDTAGGTYSPISGRVDGFTATDSDIYDIGSGVSINSEQLRIVGGASWGPYYYITKQANSYDRTKGFVFESDAKGIGSRGRYMFGVFDSSSGTSYTDMVYALYAYNIYTQRRVYEDGTFRIMTGPTINADTTYHLKIVVKPEGGARYYVDGVEIYDSNYSTENNLRVGYTTNNATQDFDNLEIAPLIQGTSYNDPSTDNVAPNAASAPTIEALSSNSVRVSWTGVSDNGVTKYYKLQRKDPNDNTSALTAAQSATVTSGVKDYYIAGTNANSWETGAFVDVVGLDPNTQYCFTAKSRDNALNEASASSQGCGYTGANAPNVPALTAHSWDTTNGNSISVNIDTNSNPAGTEFAVACDDSGTNWLQNDGSCAGAKVWKTEANWETGTVNYLKGLVADTDYSLVTLARNTDSVETSNSTASDSVKTAPAQPTGLAKASITPTSITWNLNDNAVVPDGYQLLNNADEVVEASATSDFVQDQSDPGGTPLTVNTQYTVKVRGIRDGLTGQPTTTLSVYTAANPPITLSHSDIDEDSVTWTWNTNSNPAGTEFYANDDSGINSGWVADGASWISTNPAKTANTQYTVTAKARNGDDIDTTDLQYSAYTAIETPTTITVGLITPNSIALNISDSLTNLNIGSSGIQYEETSGNQNGGGEAAFTTWPQSASTTDTGLKGAVSGAVGTTYKYKIKARNAEGVETAQSGEFSFTTTAGTQLLFQLPGETLDESGAYLLSYSDPTPNTVVAGVPFNIEIKAADPANYRDLTHQDIIALTSTDPVAQFPAAVAMTNGAITYNNVIFQTVGNQTISGLGSAGSSHEFAVVAGECSPGDSTVTASPTSLYVDQTSTVTITVMDSFGNKLAGHAVSVSSDQPEDGITFSADQTDANGRIYAYVTSAIPHTSTITARDTTDGVTLTDKPQITFNAVVIPPTPTPTPTATPTPTPTVSPGDSEAPTAPSNLRATDVTSITIDLAWDASTDNVGVTGYELYNVGTNILITTTSLIYHDLLGLTPEATYRFHVRAFDAAGNFSPFSNILTITTLPLGPGEEEEEAVVYLVMGGLPKEIDAGQPFPENVRVSAVDGGGKIIAGYDKAIYFSSSDKNAKLTYSEQNHYTYTALDAGIHEFAGRDFVLNTAGTQKLTVSDHSTVSSTEILVRATTGLPVVRNFLTKPENLSKVNTGVVTTTAAILLIPLLINTALNFGTLLPQLIYWATQLLQLLGIRKRRKSWGMVFNSQTGQPISLAIVRILDKKYNRVLEQAVADNQGRYGFLVREGTFYITASKSGFSFPPKEKTSSFYEKIYAGGDFKIAGKEQTVAYNIPLDPQVRPGLIISLWVFFIRFNRFLAKLRLPLLVIGIIFCLVMMVVAFEIIYLLSFVFYILLGILEYLRTRKARPYGVVTDTYNHPLETVIVRIYKKDNNRLIETDVTDRDGRFRFLVAPGVYYLSATKPGFIDFKSHLMYLQKERTQVSTTIKLKKEEK